MAYSKVITKELALNGKLITSADPVTIGTNFQTYKNLRYGENAPEGILGMSKINPTVLSNYLKIRSGFHFRKEQPAESHILAQAWNTGLINSVVIENTSVIPAQGNFSSTILFGDTTGSEVGRFSKAPNGQMAYCNGISSCIWSGNEIRISRFINYKASDETVKYDVTELLDNNDINKCAVLVNDTTGCYMYIGLTRLSKGLKFYVGTGNTTPATLAIQYWTGTAWATPTGLIDNTSTAGKTLNKTGTVVFDVLTDTMCKPRVIDGVYLYWLKVYTSASLSTTNIYYVTTDMPFQLIKDIWDGEYRSELAFQIYKNNTYNDYSINVHEDSYDSLNNATFIELDGLTASQYLVVGFPEQITALAVHLIGGHVNTTTNTGIYVSKWDGSSWILQAGVIDGTSEGSISFAKSGIIQWNAAESYKRTIGNEIPLYYYKISFNQTLSSDVQMYYIAGIPEPKSRSTGYIGRFSFPVYAKDRLWLCCDKDKEKNKVICSMKDAPDVWNGDDSTEFYFGDESDLIAGCSLYSRLGSSIYNIVIFFKNNAMYGITGNSPADFVQYEISSSIGCIAPLTLKTTIISVGGNSRPVAIFQGSNGIYIFDNTSPIPIHDDIKDIFDKNSSTAINPLKIADSVAFVDEENSEYHWLFAQGSSTTLNKEFVYDLKKGQWFEIDRGAEKYLQCGFEVEDTYGNTYCYGAIDTGYLERLENGITFDGNDIIHILKTGDIAPLNGSIMYESQIIRHKIVMKSKNTTTNNLVITHYGDGYSTGIALTPADPTKSNYRITDIIDNLNIGNHIFHALEYSMTTNDETKGFEPLFIGMKFNVLGEDLS